MSDSEVTKDNRFAGAIGADYDETFKLICPHLDQLEQSVADGLLTLRDVVRDRNLRVLDVGCGDGLTAQRILHTVEGVDLVALDNEPQMIHQIKANLRQIPLLSSVKFELEDALSYLRRCEDGAFDGIGSCFVLHNFQDDYRRDLLKELYRVLKPHGRFVNGDKLAQPDPVHSQTLVKQVTLMMDTYIAAGRLDLLREWVVHYLEDNVPGRRWAELDAVKDLGLAGFKKIDTVFRCDMEATVVAVKSA